MKESEEISLNTNTLELLNLIKNALVNVKNNIDSIINDMKKDTLEESLHRNKEVSTFYTGASKSNVFHDEILNDLKDMLKDINIENKVSQKFIENIENLFSKKFIEIEELSKDINIIIGDLEVSITNALFNKNHIDTNIDVEAFEESIDGLGR